MKLVVSVLPPTGGRVPDPRLQSQKERSGAARTPRVHEDYDDCSAKLLLLISPNLLAMGPLRAKVEAKRAPKTMSLVEYFIEI